MTPATRFAGGSGRSAHLSGKVAQALMAKAADLLARAPEIHRVDVTVDKLPASQ